MMYAHIAEIRAQAELTDRRCGTVHQQSPTDGAPPADVLTAVHSAHTAADSGSATAMGERLCVGSVDMLVRHSNCGRCVAGCISLM